MDQKQLSSFAKQMMKRLQKKNVFNTKQNKNSILSDFVRNVKNYDAVKARLKSIEKKFGVEYDVEVLDKNGKKVTYPIDMISKGGRTTHRFLMGFLRAQEEPYEKDELEDAVEALEGWANDYKEAGDYIKNWARKKGIYKGGAEGIENTVSENKMKLTKRQLKRIIKEEYTRILSEMGHGNDPVYGSASKNDPVIRQDMVDYLRLAIDHLGPKADTMDGLDMLGYLRRMQILIGGKLITPTDEECMEAMNSY